MSREALADLSVRSLLTDVSTGNLAPGGISMAALAGGMAAALVTLVGRLTAATPGYEPMKEEMERLIERAKVLEDQLLGAMDQEVEAFNQLAGSMGLPRGSNDEQAIRRDCISLSRRGYTQVPLQVGGLAVELCRLAETAVRYGNRSVVADAGAGFLAAAAAARAAVLHVLVNAHACEEAWAVSAREKAQAWLAEVPALEAEIWPHLLQQVSPS